MMVRSAEAFATAAHEAVRQRRKYTGEPYIVHPRHVHGLVVGRHGITWEGECAAWLHDVVEDTGVASETIGRFFGDRVERLVKSLTNVPKGFGNRKARFEANLAKLADAEPEAQTVKLADLISNTSTIVVHDPWFAMIYLREKERTLGVLEHGDTALQAICRQTLEQSWARLAEKGYVRH
ncbi:MAG: hypothetical protein DI537_14010 [Stutzerimonas stutzeri]|nr:MAG: hypothetical protein DI537_14010 [Stutzerimonas stutzeri]